MPATRVLSGPRAAKTISLRSQTRPLPSVKATISVQVMRFPRHSLQGLLQKSDGFAGRVALLVVSGSSAVPQPTFFSRKSAAYPSKVPSHLHKYLISPKWIRRCARFQKRSGIEQPDRTLRGVKSGNLEKLRRISRVCGEQINQAVCGHRKAAQRLVEKQPNRADVDSPAAWLKAKDRRIANEIWSRAHRKKHVWKRVVWACDHKREAITAFIPLHVFVAILRNAVRNAAYFASSVA